MFMEENIYINGLIDITDKEFKLISNLVYDKFGINLTDKKRSLVVGRLNKLIKNLGLKSFNEYYELVINDNTNASLLSLIDRISTNHTFFYREKSHFEYLKDIVLPEMTQKIKADEKKKELRIWCAGCATGEEAYTLSMVLNDFFETRMFEWDVGILATDISVTSLEKAQNGVYVADKIQNLPISYKHKYLIVQEDSNYKVKDVLRNILLFKRLNLMNKSYPFKNKFHIIFCRNVMIYFDKQTKDSLVNRFYNYMYDSGYLFVGHSESLDRKECPFEYLQPAIYKKLY